MLGRREDRSFPCGEFVWCFHSTFASSHTYLRVRGGRDTLNSQLIRRPGHKAGRHDFPFQIRPLPTCPPARICVVANKLEENVIHFIFASATCTLSRTDSQSRLFNQLSKFHELVWSACLSNTSNDTNRTQTKMRFILWGNLKKDEFYRSYIMEM